MELAEARKYNPNFGKVQEITAKKYIENCHESS